MISPTDVYWAAAGIYAVSLVVLLGWLRGIPDARRRYCYPVVAVVGVAAVTTALSALGVGVVALNGSELDVPSVADDLFAYSVLWVTAAMLADESRRMLGLFAAVPIVQVLAFNLAGVGGGVLGLVGLLVVVAGHGLIAYLLFGRIWRRAERVPGKQRLLHWKSRNLLLFLVGMLIAFALLSVASVFDAFVAAVLGEYVGLLIRVGFAGFLFANVDSIALDQTSLGNTFDGPGNGASVTGGAVTPGDSDD